MSASDFSSTPPREFAPWQRFLSYVLLYGLALPVVRCFEAAGKWPHLMARRTRVADNPFGEYQPNSHDVIVCSYFKSGTTWTLQMAIQVAHKGAAEFRSLHDAVAWPDVPEIFRSRVIPLDNSSPVKSSPTGLRVIKTHLPQVEVPYSPEARYIAVVRDPKDVCVSGYHFQRSMLLGPLAPSVAHYVDFFLSPEFPIGSWGKHVDGYWRLRDRENVLFLTYEEMKRDGAAAIRRIAQFMKVDLRVDEFDEVVRRSSFKYMKSADEFNPGRIVPWGKEQGYFVRRGKSGGSAELLTEDLRQRIDEHFRSELDRLGCDFPYDEAFQIAR
jgi:hypothetical protein